MTRNWDSRDMVRTLRADARFDCTRQLGKLTMPSLPIGGRSDPTYPASMLEQMCRAMPDARCRIYDGGHAGALRNPQLWNDVRGFLGANPLASVPD